MSLNHESRWERKFAAMREQVEGMTEQDMASIGISKKAQRHFIESIPVGRSMPVTGPMLLRRRCE